MKRNTNKVQYDPSAIEEKWQETWEAAELFQQQPTDNPKDKQYLLFAFAYPSGSGLHVGHVESKTALDIVARFNRMLGKDVYFPVGWDAFGLPAENYAIKTGVHPAETTKQAIDTFHGQIKRLGISYDWANEIATSHPEYYRWTQWLFLQLYEKGLAYRGMGTVNWCPKDQTVLANEQVVEGRCERCGTEVVQKELEQWYFKITEYRDELLSGLEEVDWPEATKQHQRNWIGKSEGLKETWQVKDLDLELESFTTWPHTTWGATFMVVAPEHPVIDQLVAGTEQEQAIADFRQEVIDEKGRQKHQEVKEKKGVFTGRYAINPLTGWEMPIYVANFAIMEYGTGIVKGCPAHDERDYEFAKKYDLRIEKVIDSGEADQPEPYIGEGTMVNAGDLTGMKTEEAREKIVEQAIDVGYGERATFYKLRDWLISRQRYWGAPIPIVYDPEGKPHPVKEEHLPWELPTDVDFKPTGESPLKSSKEFIERTETLYGKGWRPEFDTMDTFVDSSWYFLRYLDSRNTEAFADPQRLKAWLPVDLYMIGPEHIVLHLLYARFFTKFLRDEGYFSIDEPFAKMRHQGMILGPDGKKMSKSKGNVIAPETVIEKYGADTLRMYEMFMGPLEADKPWDDSAVAGVHRFLSRVHFLASQDFASATDPLLARKLHQTIKKVTEDIPALKFNTAIAAMMECVNLWEKLAEHGKKAVITQDDALMFVKILAPFAPFLGEELYGQIVSTQNSGKYQGVHVQTWPKFDAKLAQEEQLTIAVQVDGKVRGELEIDAGDVDEKDSILEQARELPEVRKWLEGKQLAKEVYVPGRIISFATQ